MNTKNQNLSILILSYDGFSDVWPIMLHYFSKHWADCPYDTYLLTNYKTINMEGIVCLQVGEDKSWSDNVLNALDKIESEFVLTIFDDFIFSSNVITKEICRYLELAVYNRYDYLHLQPKPKPSEKINNSLGRIKEGALYRVSLCNTIIKKSVLIDLLRPNENAWEFEYNGSIRSDKYYHFYASYKQVISYYNAIEKGRWRREAVNIAEEFGIDTRIRGICKDRFSDRWTLIKQLKHFILFRIIKSKHQRVFLKAYQNTRDHLFFKKSK